MPKMKSKSGAKKRFLARAGGSIKRGQAFKRHILTKKTTKQKRQLRGAGGSVRIGCEKRARDVTLCLTGENYAKSQTWGNCACPS